MKNLLLVFLSIAFLAACSSSDGETNSTDTSSSKTAISTTKPTSGSSKGYPKEYTEMNLPTYSNIISMGKSESKALGDGGDIQMSVQLKTLDNVSKIGNFYDSSFQKLGYKKSTKDKLKELQENGAPYDPSNFYHGYFQNLGKVATITAITESDTTAISITFMGS